MAASHLRLCIGLPVGGIESPSTAHALHVALRETEKEKKENNRKSPIGRTKVREKRRAVSH